MIARILIFAGLCMAASNANALDGSYTARGTNLDGSRYAGTAEITLTSQTTCRIVWTTGSTSSNGICMRYGNAFSAAYTLNGSIGLVIYRIEDNGVLEGRWTITGMDGSGSETLTPR